MGRGVQSCPVNCKTCGRRFRLTNLQRRRALMPDGRVVATNIHEATHHDDMVLITVLEADFIESHPMEFRHSALERFRTPKRATYKE